MIDFETELFDAVVKAVKAKHGNITATSMNLNAPASFPAMSMVESGSETDRLMSDSSDSEVAAIVTYDVKTFSSLTRGAKAQAKAILATVDDYMCSHNFTRTYRSQGSDLNDPSIYTASARYQAGIDRNGKLYRR